MRLYGAAADDGPAELVSFSTSRQTVTANGTEIQEAEFIFDNAADLDNLRMITNHVWHSENGRFNDSYFWWTEEDGFFEYAPSYNEHVTLLPQQSEVYTDMQGQRVFIFAFVVEPSFGAADNNQISTYWKEGDDAHSWTRATDSGDGFDVVE